MLTKIHPEIYYYNLNNYRSFLEEAKNIISESEKEKARQFVKQNDSENYILQRFLLRKTLAPKLSSMSPRYIEFHYNNYGKPYVLNTPWQFNISHSKDMLMIGLIENFDIGVDIEFVDDKTKVKDLIDLVFTNAEKTCFKESLAKERQAYFYSIWTKKEAYSKAVGKGLNINFSLLDLNQQGTEIASSGFKNGFSWAYYCIKKQALNI